MIKEHHEDVLAQQTTDYVASAAKSVLGVVPFVGSLLVEIAGTLIPNQRIDRIARFAEELEARLYGIEQDFVRAQLADEYFTDLIEEGLRQAARSLSQDRRAHIASVISNSLTSENISFVESKHLLDILGQLNDIEVVRLGSYLYQTFGSGGEYREKHQKILEPVRAHLGSQQKEVDKATLQLSFDEHLAQLGLLDVRYKVDSRTKQPEFDDSTGAQKVSGYGMTRLGKLLLQQAGVLKEG